MSEAKQLTGFPSIDKPWQKYYSDEAINGAIDECKIYEKIWNENKDHLEDVAILYYGRKTNYRQLFSNIEKTAAAFVAEGVKAGDYVTVCSVNMPEVVYAFYALNRIGAVANMVDPRTNTERIGQYMKDAGSSFVLTLDRALPRFTKLCDDGIVDKIVILSPADSLPMPLKLGYKMKNKVSITTNDRCRVWKDFIQQGAGTKIEDYPYEKDYPAAVVYTGGTTGIPKGAVLSNDLINTVVCGYKDNGLSFARGDKCLSIMPPFIAYGVSVGIHLPISAGVTDIVIPQFNPEELGKLISKHRAQHFIGVPSHLEQLPKSPGADNMDLSFFKTAGCGGDLMTPESERRINQYLSDHGCTNKVIQGYGMTEMGGTAVTNTHCAVKPGSVGIPLPKNNISVRDPETKKELTYNTKGEIYLMAPAYMSRYINAPEEQKKLFWTDDQDKVWVKTGDVGYVDEDGFVFLMGRMKRMVIRPDGHNVWPSQIEEVLLRHPSVDQCSVVGCPVPDGQNGKIPTAFIVVKEGVEQTDQLLKEIEEFSKIYMPERDTASAFRFIDKIPMTPIGKVDYRALENIDNA